MLYLGILDPFKFSLKFTHFNVVLSEEEVIIIDTLLTSGGGLESCYIYIYIYIVYMLVMDVRC